MDLPPTSTSKVGAARARCGVADRPHRLGAKEAPSPNGGASPEVVSPTNSLFAIPSLQQTSDERDCHNQSAHAANGNGSVDGRLGDASQSTRDCSGRHALAIEARAERPVGLIVRKLKVVDCVSQPVTRETVGAKD